MGKPVVYSAKMTVVCLFIIDFGENQHRDVNTGCYS